MPPRFPVRTAPHDCSTDLRLASLALPARKGPALIPRNLTELSSVLKKRIANREPEQANSRGRTQEWLISKGVDLQKMTDHLADASTRSSNRQYRTQYSRGTVEPLLLMQQTHLEREVHYQLHRQGNESRLARNTQVRLHNRLLASIYPRQYQPVSSPFSLPPPISVNHKASLKSYAKCLVNQAKKRKDNQAITPKMWARAFGDSVDWRMWRILEKQLGGINQDVISMGPIRTKQQMLINSLKVVEKQLEEELPLNQETVSHYLVSKYLNHCKPGQYIIHSTHDSMWGKAFLYFRAGRIKKCLKIMNSAGQQQVARIIRDSNQSVRINKPKRYELPPIDEKDIFYEQLAYSVSGISKYSSSLFSDVGSLDLVWILLRNTGVFYEVQQDYYEQLSQQIVTVYRQNQIKGNSLEYMAYLLDYDSIVIQSQGQQMSQHDLVHLLIMLHHYPFLSRNPASIRQRLTEALTQYVIEVAREMPGPAFQYYLMQIPADKIVEAGSIILVSNNLYPQVEWGIFKDNLPRDTFGRLMERTTREYVATSGKYFECALHVVAYTEERSAGLDLLAAMMVKQIRDNRSYSEHEVKKTLWKMREWIDQEVELQREYETLFEFMSRSYTLNHYLMERKYDLIQKEITTSRFMTLTAINFEIASLFEKLAEIKGEDAYFLYLGQLLTAAECVLSRSGRQYDLREVRHRVYKNCQTVAQSQRFSGMTENMAMRQLVEGLNQVLFGTEFDRV